MLSCPSRRLIRYLRDSEDLLVMFPKYGSKRCFVPFGGHIHSSTPTTIVGVILRQEHFLCQQVRPRTDVRGGRQTIRISALRGCERWLTKIFTNDLYPKACRFEGAAVCQSRIPRLTAQSVKASFQLTERRAIVYVPSMHLILRYRLAPRR